jgi:hypothetical protein
MAAIIHINKFIEDWEILFGFWALIYFCIIFLHFDFVIASFIVSVKFLCSTGSRDSKHKKLDGCFGCRIDT